MADRQRIEVRYVVNDTTDNDTWFADTSAITLLAGGRCSMRLVGGTDADGNRVVSAQYAHAERVVRYLEEAP